MNNARVLELYDLYAENVYKLAYSYMGNRADAEDIVQNVFFALLRKNIRIGEGKEKSYILRMTANACKDQLRSKKRLLDIPFENLNDSGGQYELTDEENTLLQAIGRLPEKTRTVFHLHYYEGYSVKEISRMLRISASAVTMRMSRGRDQLKEIISWEESS